MVELISSFSSQILVAVDVETTGLSAIHGDRICEVGIVSAQDGQVLETYQTLVNPQRSISPGAARVNGLRDEDVCHAPRFEEIADQVLERVDGAVLVCHNAPFDLGFLEAMAETLDSPLKVIPIRTATQRYQERSLPRPGASTFSGTAAGTAQ